MLQSSNEPQKKPAPLEGIKVVEYGVFHAGPGAGAILGDLGANVIKIECGIGDPMRYWTHVGGVDVTFENGESALYEVTNRNKRGLFLDIKTEKGREVLHRLIKDADIFLTNLRKSTKTKLEIDYPSISKVNPKIIHANVSGYGPEGLMSDIGAFDPMGQAISGMMFATATSYPAILRHGILDQATAIALSHAILTALFVRERQGIGQEVHVSLYSTALWLQQFNVIVANGLHRDPCKPADRYEHSPLRNFFCCKDGKWIMSTHHPEEKYWTAFCNLTGQSALLNNPQYTDESGAPAISRELVEIFDKVIATKTRDEWMETFISYGLMFCPVKQISECETDSQALANNYIVPVDHPVHGTINFTGYPVHFSACDAGTRSFAPPIGKHTHEILLEIGYGEQEIERLKKEEIIK